ncbi:MAG: HAMP domain-containing sensor histidine kinase [Candidatus Wallbacteria bacterium]|nr:HAMP domain-containing sensor histidine kinase [Candidatus Wallbacteria bacterium]
MRKKIRTVFFLLIVLFLLSAVLAFSLTGILRQNEVASVLNTSGRVSEAMGLIEQTVGGIAPGRMIIDSTVRRHAPEPPSDFEQVRETIRNLYDMAATYYRAGDYERAVHYWQNLTDRFSAYATCYSGSDNPVLFAGFMLCLTYSDQYSRQDPALKSRLTEFLAGPSGPGRLIIQALFEQFPHLFNAQDQEFILASACYHSRRLENQIRIAADVSGSERTVFCFDEGENRYCLLVEGHGSDLKVSLSDFSTLENEFSRVKSLFDRLGYHLTFETMHERIHTMPHAICGIGFALTAASDLERETGARVNRKYGAVLAFLLAVFAAILFALGRYFLLLHRLEAMKDNFLNVISHELKTPLSGIKLYADTIVSNRDPAKTGEFASVISSKSTQIENLIANLLYFSRSFNPSEISKLRQGFRPVAFKSLIEAVCHDYSLASFKAFELDLRGLPGLSIHGDEHLVRIVFANLVENSFKYIEADLVKISVSIREQDETLCVTYTDNGKIATGIDPEQLFTKYVRNDSTGKSGLGLGLFIVRKLTELLDGTVHAAVSDSLVLEFRFKIKAGK